MGINEIQNAIEAIEADIYESLPESVRDDNYYSLTLTSSAYGVAVKFAGIYLWDSENDEREYIDEKEDKEDLELHLRKKLREELKNLRRIVV